MRRNDSAISARHHCRGCGELFCSACTPPRPESGERACGPCAAAARAASQSTAPALPASYVLGQRLPGDIEEGLRVEFKDTHRHRFHVNIGAYVLKNVTGFLNSRQGGTLYFGIDDASGRVCGVPFPAGDEGREFWDKWSLSAGTALRRCRECGGGRSEEQIAEAYEDAMERMRTVKALGSKLLQ